MEKNRQRYKFKGTFREYQERVLRHSDRYLADNHIHIVAAPGSGKTILGLELICRLDEPALVLSPTLSIRNQWRERFEEHFLMDEDIDDIVSTSLKDVKFITSITYQTLHSAYNKLDNDRAKDGKNLEKDDTSDNWEGESEIEDFGDFELLNVIKQSEIKTICLDEAHHLRSEWQKSLKGFLDKLDDEYKIIALTATPPYDSNRSEWDKYISVCGEIDDEIFVPELVKTGDLCCHQDYIYFNYPSTDEIDIIEGHNRRVDDFLDELSEEGIIQSLATENFIFKDPDRYLDICFDDEENFVGFLKLLDLANEDIPKDIDAMFLNHHTKIQFDTGLQFVYDHSELFPETLYETVIDKLKNFKLIEKNRVRITSDRKINRLMF